MCAGWSVFADEMDIRVLFYCPYCCAFTPWTPYVYICLFRHVFLRCNMLEYLLPQPIVFASSSEISTQVFIASLLYTILAPLLAHPAS